MGTISATGASSGSLAFSTASNFVVQPQPAPGSCHAIGSGLNSRPDPRCTPGALNPQVTQATIHRTICARGWTATVRPPESITEPEKRASMAAYGDRLPIWNYEYDHFVPLELGGATNDRRNLWPEPGASPNRKDAVEHWLGQQVCDGQMSLSRAQRAIVSNWVAIARRLPPSPGSSTGTQPGSGASCRASAHYNSYYADWDVYVYSNQPDQTVTVTGAGTSATWHTNGSGYADVYLHASSGAAGQRVTVRVGGATCWAVL